MPRGRPSRATVYARLDSAMTQLNERFGSQPTPAEAGYVWDDIWHMDDHHSTARSRDGHRALSTLSRSYPYAMVEVLRDSGDDPLDG